MRLLRNLIELHTQLYNLPNCRLLLSRQPPKSICYVWNQRGLRCFRDPSEAPEKLEWKDHASFLRNSSEFNFVVLFSFTSSDRTRPSFWASSWNFRSTAPKKHNKFFCGKPHSALNVQRKNFKSASVVLLCNVVLESCRLWRWSICEDVSEKGCKMGTNLHSKMRLKLKSFF